MQAFAIMFAPVAVHTKGLGASFHARGSGSSIRSPVWWPWIVVATFAGVVRGQRDMEAFARSLSQGQLRVLGFRINRQTRRIRCPIETAFFRVLQAVEENLLERILLRWQQKVWGPVEDEVIATPSRPEDEFMESDLWNLIDIFQDVLKLSV